MSIRTSKSTAYRKIQIANVVNVKNELIRGETGWSTFEEREAKVMASWLLRIVFSENRMADLGRACLLEIWCKSGWWARCRHYM